MSAEDDHNPLAGGGPAEGSVRPHQRLTEGDRDTIAVLRALYIWRRDGKLPPRGRISTELCSTWKSEQTVRDNIERFGQRLRLQEQLIVQGPGTTRVWRLTDVGQKLAAAAERILGTLDQEIDDLDHALARDLTLLEPIHVGCFNAQVKLYLARALGSLVSDPDFGCRVRFNRDMNLRAVNTSVILEDVGREQPKGASRDPGLHRYRGFHYGVVPWDSRKFPGQYGHYTHKKLYDWKLLVVTPEESPLRHLEAVSMAEVIAECEAASLPLLLTPPSNISRIMVDEAFATQCRVPVVSYIIENPDSYTRYELASHGHGVAVVTADTLPPLEADPYPVVAGPDEEPLSGFHTLTWRGSGSKDGDEDPPPVGVTSEVHRRFCAAVKEEVARFAHGRQGVSALAWS